MKTTTFAWLLILMLLPLRAAAADIVETFEGRSSVTKGETSSSGYYANQDAELNASFQYKISGGSLKLASEEKSRNFLRRKYVGTIYRGQNFDLSVKCLRAEGDLKEDFFIELLVQDMTDHIHNQQWYERGGELPREAQVSYKPSKYSGDSITFQINGILCYCDGCQETLGLSVGVEIIIEVNIEGDADVAEQKEAVYTEDNDAREEPGGDPWPYAIPGSVVVALLGYSLTRKPKGGSQEQPRQEDLPDRMEMRIYKTFGDTLQVGAMPQRVFAQIVGFKNNEEYIDLYLTSQITINGDNCITSQDAGMDSNWRCADIQAVNPPQPNGDGVVTFTLNAGAGLYNNRLHFKIKEGEMHFAQENLTLPACYDKAVFLPFVIDGMEEDANVTAVVYEKDGQPTNMYEVRVQWNAKKEVQEAVIIDKVLDKEKDCHTPGHFIEFNLHLEADNGKGLVVKSDFPLLRYYMGMVYDIGVGYEGYEVGCYLEEYNPEKHTQKLVWGVSAGKTYVPHETEGFLRIYDYDEENHCILIVKPSPDPKLFSIKAVDETEQHRIDRLGLNYEAKDTGHPRGTRIILRCLQGLLDAPSRIDAVVTFGTKYNNQEYKCETQVLLCSQPRRILKEAAAWDALIKEDRRMLKNMDSIENLIVQWGILDRLMPLVKYIHILRDGYLEDYGLDRDAAKTVARVFAFMTNEAADYSFDEGYKPLTLGGEIEQWFKDYAQAMFTTAKQVNEYLAVPIMIARIALGIKTMGATEGFFRLYDAFSIGLMEISLAELYVEQGRDAVTKQMKIMAIEAAKWQIFSLGIKACVFVYAAPVGGQPPLSARASTSRPKARIPAKSSTKNYSSGKKGTIAKQVIEESNRRQQIAKDTVRSPIEKARAKTVKPKRDLTNAIKYGEAKSVQDIKDLRTTIELCKSNPTPENKALLRKLVIDVQSNKQAMNKLKALGPEYNKVRQAFNQEMMDIYRQTDKEVIQELAKKYHLDPSEIRIDNVSNSDYTKLLTGESITFDRDTTYYIVRNGKKVYFDQQFTEQLYNRRFYKNTLGYESSDQAFANRFSRTMDQTNIEDVMNHPESFGAQENVDILFDKSRHTEALPNAKKVRDAIIYKTEERLWEAEEKLKIADTLTDAMEREKMEARAVWDMMEGNRQTMKDFRNFTKPYNDARADITGNNYVTDNMRKAVEDVALLFEGKPPIDINECESRLALRGYTFSSLAHDVADAMYKASITQ